MANVKSQQGRTLAGLVLAGAVLGLVIVLQSGAEQRSWASAEGTVQERQKSDKRMWLRIEYPLPDGSRQVATLPENGPARLPGERVTVRYDLEDGKVVDATLGDDDQVYWVLGAVLGVAALGGIFLNVVAWTPARKG